eukprot:jgi/Bigna1/87507/estExt_fgenesh1_pg.C_210071
MIDPLLLDKKDLMMGSSSAESTSKEELIDYILSLRSRHKNGVGMDSEDRERVAEMAAALAQLNPQPIPANSAKNDGNWTLIYTTTEEQASGKVTLDGLLGTFEVPVVGDVNQFIDFRSKTYTNTISSQPWFRATLEAEFAVLDAHTWKIKFTRFMSQGFGGRKVQDLKLGGEDDVGAERRDEGDVPIKKGRGGGWGRGEEQRSSNVDDASESSNLFILARPQYLIKMCEEEG